MGKWIDDFSTYTEGWLDDQGDWSWDSYPLADPNHLWVDAAGDYVYGMGSWFTSRYYANHGIMGSNDLRKARMMVKCKIIEDYGWISCGFSENYYDSDYGIMTGFDLTVESGGLYFRYIKNGVASAYYSDSYAGELITVEFEHNYSNETFTYIKCDYAGVDLTDVPGSTDPGTPIQENMSEQSETSQKSQIHYFEVQSFKMPKNAYKCFPRWEKTKYGLRPCY